jgi:antitoxin component of MazEF toxin-antitoxin module
MLMCPGQSSRWGKDVAIRIGKEVLERAGLHVGDAVEVIASDDAIAIRRQRPRVTMAELLARFDPATHRYGLAFDGDPVGSETP